MHNIDININTTKKKCTYINQFDMIIMMMMLKKSKKKGMYPEKINQKTSLVILDDPKI